MESVIKTKKKLHLDNPHMFLKLDWKGQGLLSVCIKCEEELRADAPQPAYGCKKNKVLPQWKHLEERYYAQ